MTELIGIGAYTPAEAGRLLRVNAAKISRWLRGHTIRNQYYEPLWDAEIRLSGDRVFLGFRDLMEVRVASAFINLGVSAIRVRATIKRARDIIGADHPLSTNRFRTDGREIFLWIIETNEDGQEREKLLNLFKSQYEFKSIIDPILKTVDFDEAGEPTLWWPQGRRAKVVLDPTRSFGQPIDSASSVPTSILAASARVEGISGTAHAYDVAPASVRRAVEFEAQLAA